jgi:hypothetical protein
MSKLIRRTQNLLLKIGISISTKQTSTTVNDLLKLVWPIKTDLPLIRIGSQSRADGGYLVPDDLEGINRLYSPGVSKTMEFEKYFLAKGIPCELIDGSVDGAPETHVNARFQKLWLAAESAPGRTSLDDWVSESSGENEELALQIDIEGSEYECLLAASDETLMRFRFIVLEVHDLRSAFTRSGLALLNSLLRKLKASHEIVHLHPNNCCGGVFERELVWPDVLELTFIRKDRISETMGPAELPHPLDRDNTPNPPLVLKSPNR